MTAPADDAVLAALQAALAAEHAAGYLAEVLAARTAPAEPLRAELEGLVAAHHARRDRLASEVVARGAAPVGPAAAYDLPVPLATDAQRRDAGAHAEEALCAAYPAVVAAASGGLRRWAVTAWQDVAVAAVRLGAAARPLPGLPATGA